MKPQYHVASSAIVASILYLVFKSWSMALSCFLSGILIDLDHIFDYIRQIGFPFKIIDIVKAASNNNKTNWTIVFHSWELLFLLAICTWYTNWNPWITGVLFGFGHHLVMDALHNTITLRTYSFIWRWKNNFECRCLCNNCAKTE